MTIERLEELKEWFHDVAGRLVSTFHAENCYLIDHLIEAEIDRQSAIKAKTDKIPRVRTLPASWDEENRTTEPLDHTEQLERVTDCHVTDEEIIDTLDWERDNLHFIESSPINEWTERNAKRKRITIQALINWKDGKR